MMNSAFVPHILPPGRRCVWPRLAASRCARPSRSAGGWRCSCSVLVGPYSVFFGATVTGFTSRIGKHSGDLPGPDAGQWVRPKRSAENASGSRSASVHSSVMRSPAFHSVVLLSHLALFCGAACSAPPTPIEDEGEDTEQTGGSSTTAEPSSSTTPSTKPGAVAPKPSGSTEPPSVPVPVNPVTPEPTLPVPEDHVPMFDPDYPGIDIALPGDKAPSGCSD